MRRTREALAVVACMLFVLVAWPPPLLGQPAGQPGKPGQPGTPAPTAEQRKAQEAISQAVKLHEEGGRLMDKQDYTSAAAKFVEALKANPNMTPAWEDLGLVYLSGGQIENAEYCLKKAKTLGGNVSALEQQVGKAKANKRPKKPEPTFDNMPPDALEPNNPFGIPAPKSPPTQREFQVACKFHEQSGPAFEARDFPAAMKSLKQAISTFPSHRGAWEDLGLCYFETGNVRLLKAVIARVKKFKFDSRALEERLDVLVKSGAVEAPEPGSLPSLPK